MRKGISVIIFLLLISAVYAQKVVNDPNAEPRSVGSFHAIRVSNAFDVLISQSNEEGLAVSASEKEDLTYIKTVVENGVLVIDFAQKNKWIPKNRKLRAYISVKSLDELKGSGAVKITIDETLNTASLKIGLSGASKLKGAIVVSGALTASLSGASDMDITGSASELTINANGASDLKAYDFKTSTCSIDASGASRVQVTVDKELNAKLSGASTVQYKGSASIRDIRTSGASSISRKS